MAERPPALGSRRRHPAEPDPEPPARVPSTPVPAQEIASQGRGREEAKTAFSTRLPLSMQERLDNCMRDQKGSKQDVAIAGIDAELRRRGY